MGHRAAVSIGQDYLPLFQLPELQLDSDVLRDAHVHGPGIGQRTHLRYMQLGAGEVGDLN